MSTLRAVDIAAAPAALTLRTLEDRATISVSEAAELLGIGRNAAYEAAHRGDIPSLKFGSRIVIPVKPLLRLLGVEAD